MLSKPVALIGAGAMGSFFAPRLFETFGDNFFLIADSSRKIRLKEQGLNINGKNYKFPVKSPGDKAECGLIIMSVKSTAFDEAVKQIKSFVGPNTVIMAVLNGVDSEEKLIKAYGEERVLYSFMRVSIVMKDYTCSFDPGKGYVSFGEKVNEQGAYSDRVLYVKDILDKADIPYNIPADMMHDMWFKYMCNIGENMTCALLGIPFGAFHISDNANFVRIKAMEEVVKIANRLGVGIGQKEIDEQNEFIKTLPFPNKPSTLQDLEAGKDKTEIEIFSGYIVRKGDELGIDTPVNDILYHSIKVLEGKNSGNFSK